MAILGTAVSFITGAILGYLLSQLGEHEWLGAHPVVVGLLAAFVLAAGTFAVVTTTDTSREIASMDGGCDTYRVYAQNRWAPLGTSARVLPASTSYKVGSFGANEVINVDGWVHGADAPYRPGVSGNPPPFNGDIWFHLADHTGWVSIGGVRGALTSPDETGFSPDPGQTPSFPLSCQGTVDPP